MTTARDIQRGDGVVFLQNSGGSYEMWWNRRLVEYGVPDFAQAIEDALRRARVPKDVKVVVETSDGTVTAWRGRR